MHRTYSSNRRPLSLDERRRQNQREEIGLDRRLREERESADRAERERGERNAAEEAARLAAMTPEERETERAEEAALSAEWQRECRERIERTYRRRPATFGT